MKQSNILPIVYYISALLHKLSYAEYTNLFYDYMEDGAGWEISGTAMPSTTHCLVGDCASIHKGSFITRNGISTENYHNIQLEAAITPIDVYKYDYCEVSYSVDGSNFTPLKIYDMHNKDVMSIDNLTMGTDADNQNNISIRFESIGAGTNQYYCYIDEVYVRGIPGTRNPTTAPTLSPTDIPTTAPSKAPTQNSTIELAEISAINLITTIPPTIDPTAYPTVNPTTFSTIIPTIPPSSDPTLEPTIISTIIPTIPPTTDPTVYPTADPTINPTLQPSMSPTSQPIVDPVGITLTVEAIRMKGER